MGWRDFYVGGGLIVTPPYCNPPLTVNLCPNDHANLTRVPYARSLCYARVYPLVPPPIGPRLGYILLSLLRLVPASGISSCPSSEWSPPRVYPLVPPPIGPRTGYILLSLLRLVPEGLLAPLTFARHLRTSRPLNGPYRPPARPYRPPARPYRPP
eukprot:1188528-Prorocentrum_minimum.AAC.9